jgi:hypothetical protein
MTTRDKTPWVYVLYVLMCCICGTLLVWLYFYSPIAFSKYPRRSLAPGTYCIGRCPPGVASNPSGTGDGIVGIAFFQGAIFIGMLLGIRRADLEFLRGCIIGSVIVSIVYVGLFQFRVL